MRRIITVLLALIASFLPGIAQEVQHRVILIGDAGKDTVAGPAILIAAEMARELPNTTVIFLGDNVYHQGLELKKKKFKKSELKLLSQLEPFSGYEGNFFMIPGNHDWKAGKWQGKKVLKRQEDYVLDYFKDSKIKNKNTAFVPGDGLPGPFTVMLEEKIRLIAIDTQWWLQKQMLHPVGKNGNKRNTSKTFYQRLDSILHLAKLNGEKVLMVGHHPIYSIGEHNSGKQPLRFLNNYTPLMAFGLVGANRLLVQDIKQPRYKSMNRKLLELIEKQEHLVHAAGHEHNIQYFKKGSNRFIVSGAGSKNSKCKARANNACAFYEDSQTGFVTLTYYTDGSIRVNAVMGSGEVKDIEEIR